MGVHAKQIDLGTIATLGGIASLEEHLDTVTGSVKGLGINWAALDFRMVVDYSTTTALPSATYANGTAGVGATLTATANGALTAIGNSSSSPTANQTILVKDQGAPAENGVYSVTQVGDGSNPFILTRVEIIDSPAEMAEGTVVIHKVSTDGSDNRGSSWQITSTVTTVGTDSVEWSQLSYGVSQINALLNGLSWKEVVVAATDAALPANTAAGSGEGKTLTADANGALTVDGVVVSSGDRVLVKDEVTGADNGIYVVTQTGDGSNPFILTRADDADVDGDLKTGSIVYIDQGTANADTGYGLTTDGAITVDTTSQTWAKITANPGTQVTSAVQDFSASAGTFAAGVTTFTLSQSATTSAAYQANMIVLQNGVDDMTKVNAGSETTNVEYSISGTSMVVGTDVTSSGHDYRVRYWV